MAVFDIFRKSSFAPAFFLLPAARRQALKTIYAFCRAVDDIVDNAVSPEQKAAAPGRLDVWREALSGRPARFEDEADKILWRELSGAIKNFHVQPKHLLALTDGVARDLKQNRYETFEELKVYCFGVASTVGLACLPLFGLDEERHKYFAVNLGMAVQMTNILRDVGADAARGYVYLPAENMREAGYSEADLLARVHNNAFLSLMFGLAQKTWALYNAAHNSLPPETRKSARPALVMSVLYQCLLDKLEAKKFPVFEGRVTLNAWNKTRALVSVL